jgi:hypothetical protein
LAAITVFNSSPQPTQLSAGAALGALLNTAMATTTNYDGTTAVGTAMALIFTAGTAGSQLPKLRVRYSSVAGLAATGTTAATVVRIWANNASTNTVATNNVFLGEVNVPSVTMSQAAALTQPTDYDFGLQTVPAGYRIYAGLATAIGGTNCALAVNMIGGGDYA